MRRRFCPIQVNIGLGMAMNGCFLTTHARKRIVTIPPTCHQIEINEHTVICVLSC